MSDVEIRRRIIPPLPRDLADDYRPPSLRAAGREVLDSPAMNAPNHRGAEMLSTEPTVNLRKLEERITRSTIDEIATLIQSLTYGEMIEWRDDRACRNYVERSAGGIGHHPGQPTGTVVSLVEIRFGGGQHRKTAGTAATE